MTRPRTLNRCVFTATAATALLCGCGAPIPQTSPLDVTSSAAQAKNSKTFYYTGKPQTFTVPKKATQLTVIADGAEGGGAYSYPSTDHPGFPGRVFAVLPVTGGTQLYVFVGGSGAKRGFNGGGAPGTVHGNRGGGASDVRAGGTSLTDRIVVAAGGGGAGGVVDAYGTHYGGKGGGLVGEAGAGGGLAGGGGGAGGTQSSGGAGGAAGISCYSSGSGNGNPGAAGQLGAGGAGADPSTSRGFQAGGGGGGGGYYGGGGGGAGGSTFGCSATAQGGGGGGGSSYIESGAIRSRTWTGWKRFGDGLVVLHWN